MQRSSRSFVGRFASAAASLVLAGAAQAAVVVAPNSLAGTEGNIDNCIPTIGCLDITRYQQVFAASQFASLGGPQLITQMAWRLEGPRINSNMDLSFASVNISLSTTSAAPDALSTNFAANRGADATLVRSGALTLTAVDTGAGLQAFDLVIAFDNAFLYDYSLGNLLLEWEASAAPAIRTGSFVDADNTFGDATSRVFEIGSSAFADSLGLVTQFTTQAVPLPGTLALSLLPLAWMLGRRRR